MDTKIAGSDVHFKSIVIDGLNASLFDRNLFKRLRQGGITAVNVTVSALEDFKGTMSNITHWKNMFLENSDLIMPINNVKDIVTAKKSGKIGIILGFQNTSAIEEDIELLAVFKGLPKNNIDHLPEVILERDKKQRVLRSRATQTMSEAVAAQKRPGPSGSPIFKVLHRCSSAMCHRHIAFVAPCTDFKSGTPNSQDYFSANPKEIGVRIIQLTYNERNFVGDGCFERVDAGLTKFGLNVIHRMNDLGLLIDLSHVGPKTTMEAIEVSEKPVVITHSNPRALFDYPRNKTDEQIKFLASKGGVIGASFWPFFLKKGMNSTLEDFLENIDYLVKLAGVDYVSIASDFFLNRSKEELQRFRAGRSQKPEAIKFPWPIIYPEGIRIPEEFPNVTSGLLKRGYAIDEVKKIMGGNLMRLFKDVWK